MCQEAPEVSRRVKPRALRTCVGCRSSRPKRELIRLVRTIDLKVKLDTTGKQSGRGVYLCPVEVCLETALRKNLLMHALAKGLSASDRSHLCLTDAERESVLVLIRQRAAKAGTPGAER